MIPTLISHFFEPMVVLAVVSVVAGFHAGLPGGDLARYLYGLFGLMIIPVLVIRWWLVVTKRVSDWDIRNRSQREKPLLILLAFTLLNLWYALYFGNPVLTQLFVIFIVWILGFAAVTLFWKMSGHAGITALATGFVIAWYGWAWWPVLLLVSLVGWARVVTKNHTVTQVIAGALYSWLLLVLIG